MFVFIIPHLYISKIEFARVTCTILATPTVCPIFPKGKPRNPHLMGVTDFSSSLCTLETWWGGSRPSANLGMPSVLQREQGNPRIRIWAWVKINPPGDCRFWSSFSFARVPFWVPIFDPNPFHHGLAGFFVWLVYWQPGVGGRSLSSDP